jgi:hypothetical protein
VIEKAKEWENDGFPGDIENLKIRGYLCKVEPKKFIYEPKRKAKHGLCLLLSWENEINEAYGAEVGVRLSPDREGCPAVSIWIIDTATGKEKNVRWIPIKKEYFEANKMDEMSTQNFFRHWIKYITLKDKYCSEIFGNKFRITI